MTRHLTTSRLSKKQRPTRRRAEDTIPVKNKSRPTTANPPVHRRVVRPRRILELRNQGSLRSRPLRPGRRDLRNLWRQHRSQLLKIVSCKSTKGQVVGQSELLQCHAAQTFWSPRARGRRLVVYVDEEAARYGLVKRTNPTFGSA